MSIRDEIASRVGEGRLFHLIPMIPGSQTIRTLFVSSAIHETLNGPWESGDVEFRMGRLRADFDSFIEGRIISIAIDPYKKSEPCFMLRLDPVTDEVWEIRSRAPKPGIRVFGSFAEKNIFIALDWQYRKPLGGPGSREFRDAREGAKAAWRRLFYPYPMHKGEGIDDYASNAIPC